MKLLWSLSKKLPYYWLLLGKKGGQKIRAWVDPPPSFGQCLKENVFFLLRSSLSHNSSFKCFFFCPIFRTVLSPSSFRSLPVGPCVIGSDRDWCLSMTAVVHCSTGDLWSPCPTTTTVSSSIFRRKIGLSENWLNHGKGSGTLPRPNSVSGGPAVTTV